MSIDNYEQYKRVINQITGRLYMHIYIETKKLFDLKKKRCVWLFITICFWSIYKVVFINGSEGRERDRHTETERDRDRQTERQTDRDRVTERQTETEDYKIVLNE